ncbi:MAG: glycosyltransferase, partial [Chloroflexi bacterium]|nr:glycosyltransferase [Chloroflexota bacterium]
LLFGLIRPYKGLRYLIEAVSLLHREACSIRLVVAGEFWDDIAHYRQQVQQLQLEPWVLLEDRYIPNEEVALYFSAADVFAAPYVGGSQSGAVSLALGFGLPVVATDAIWDGETLSTEYDRITVVPSADAQALAAGISQALQCRERQLPQQPEAADEGWRQLAEAVERLRG